MLAEMTCVRQFWMVYGNFDLFPDYEVGEVQHIDYFRTQLSIFAKEFLILTS